MTITRFKILGPSDWTKPVSEKSPPFVSHNRLWSHQEIERIVNDWLQQNPNVTIVQIDVKPSSNILSNTEHEFLYAHVTYVEDV